MNPSPTSDTGRQHLRTMAHATTRQRLATVNTELERLLPGLSIKPSRMGSSDHPGLHPGFRIELEAAEEWLKGSNVQVPVEWLLAAVQELGLDGFDAGERVEVPRTLLAGFAAYIRDGEPFCDHSVGICSCSSRATMEELELASRGLQTCPECHGDGVDFEKETKCARCNGACHVPIGEAP